MRGLSPALVGSELHGEHVIGEMAAERQLQGIGKKGLQFVGGEQFPGDIHERTSWYLRVSHLTEMRRCLSTAGGVLQAEGLHPVRIDRARRRWTAG